jgi:hypothetical protein
MHDNRSFHLFGGVAKTEILRGLMVVSLLFATQARAQVSGSGRSSAPIYGGTGISPRPANPVPPMQGTFAENHKTPGGKPCISVFPSARPQIINHKIVDQVVALENICGQSIRVQVCYAGTSRCIVVALQGYQTLQRILGIASDSPDFRYEYRQLF